MTPGDRSLKVSEAPGLTCSGIPGLQDSGNAQDSGFRFPVIGFETGAVADAIMRGRYIRQRTPDSGFRCPVSVLWFPISGFGKMAVAGKRPIPDSDVRRR